MDLHPFSSCPRLRHIVNVFRGVLQITHVETDPNKRDPRPICETYRAPTSVLSAAPQLPSPSSPRGPCRRGRCRHPRDEAGTRGCLQSEKREKRGLGAIGRNCFATDR